MGGPGPGAARCSAVGEEPPYAFLAAGAAFFLGAALGLAAFLVEAVFFTLGAAGFLALGVCGTWGGAREGRGSKRSRSTGMPGQGEEGRRGRERQAQRVTQQRVQPPRPAHTLAFLGAAAFLAEAGFLGLGAAFFLAPSALGALGLAAAFLAAGFFLGFSPSALGFLAACAGGGGRGGGRSAGAGRERASS